MLKRLFIAQIKQHRIASLIYTVYITLWLLVTYLTYHFLVKGDSDSVATITYYASLLSLSYLGVNILFAARLKNAKSKWFFSELNYFIALPIGIVVLIYVAHSFVAYLNMGMWGNVQMMNVRMCKWYGVMIVLHPGSMGTYATTAICSGGIS